MSSIFVFAYYSYRDPVFQSAVLSYLKMLASPDVQFVVLTWEQKQYAIEENEKQQIREGLLHQNIVWHDTRWHSGRFKPVKKAYDFIRGLLLSMSLIRRHRAQKIFSEGFPGAVIGHCLSILTGRPHIIHTFEPHADYMLESGVWQKQSWEYQLLRAVQRPIAKRAESIITATQAYKEQLVKLTEKDRVFVVPSCIDTEHYKFDRKAREDIRKQLGIGGHQIAIAYLGKIGGMYMDDEIYRFFAHCLRLDEDRFFFFLLTNEDESNIARDLERYGIPAARVFVKYLNREEVPRYLSAADIGFCGIRPLPSRRFSSPIKNGEYWACGLPTLIPHGISDDYIHSSTYDIGFSFRKVDEIGMPVLEALRQRDRIAVQEQCQPLRALTAYRETLLAILRPDVKAT